MNASLPAVSKSRTRAAITGWSLGWPNDDGRRLELDASCGSNTLRRSVERARLIGHRDATNEYQTTGAADNKRTALGRAARELERVGLWDENGLTVDPFRVAICFSSSKGEMALLENAFSARDDSSDVRKALVGAGCASHMSTHAEGQAARHDCETACEECAFWNWTPDAPARVLAQLLGARGAVLSPVAACASGAHALALGAQWIEDGRADIVIAGAMEAGLSPLVMAGYASLGALSPSGVMRPFDQMRDGFVPREGLALLVLESEHRARERGAQIEGIVAGWNLAADATAMTSMSPGGEAVARSMRNALRSCGDPSIGYINAHGTATRLNDAMEARAIAQVFGDACANKSSLHNIHRDLINSSVAVSSTKPLTGHWLGAAGALEAVLCLLALREQFAPPTLHLQNPDADCPLDFGPREGRTLQTRHALSLSYGFGGHIGALVLKK